MAVCSKRFVDAVVVYRYDRFARSLRQLVNALEEFNSLGIDFVSLHEGVDTSSPNGRLFFGIFASIAQFERELIRDRVRSGLAAAKTKGKHVGRPRVAVDVRRIESLRRQGRSWSEITRETGISKGTAQRAQASSLPKTPVAGEKIIDHSGIVWNCWTGALAHLGVARANALQARTSQGADADAARVSLDFGNGLRTDMRNASIRVDSRLKQAMLSYSTPIFTSTGSGLHWPMNAWA